MAGTGLSEPLLGGWSSGGAQLGGGSLAGGVAGIFAGWMIARRYGSEAWELRAGVMFGSAGSAAWRLIDRSAATGLDLIVGLATLASIDRLITGDPTGLPALGGAWRFSPAAGRRWS